MVLTAVAQEESLDEKWHHGASRRDRQGEELGGGPAVASEFDWACGWHGKDDTHD